MQHIIETLVTDRTAEDVRQRTAKGTYNISDMNRVEAVTAYLAGLMISLPEELRAYAEELGVEWHPAYDVPYDPEDFLLSVKTDWDVLDIPDSEDSRRYLDNIRALCGGLESNAETLPLSLDCLFYQDANAIESCLKQAAAMFFRMKQEHIRQLSGTVDAWIRTGELYAGEMIT